MRETFWLPSHGKKKGVWRPPFGDEAQWRRLNDIADAECTNCRENFLRTTKVGRDRYSAQYDQAVLWAERALDRCQEGARRYVASIPDAEHYGSCFDIRFEPDEGLGGPE